MLNKFLTKKYYWRDWLILVNKAKTTKEEQWFLPHCHTSKETYVNENWKKTYSIVISSVSPKTPVRNYLQIIHMSMENSAFKYGRKYFTDFYPSYAIGARRLTCDRRQVVGVVREGFQRSKDGPIEGKTNAAIIPSRSLNFEKYILLDGRRVHYRMFIFG